MIPRRSSVVKMALLAVAMGSSEVYDTGPITLSGGNIQLHKPNNSTVGPTSTLDDCPAFSATSGSGQCEPGLSLCSDGTCGNVCFDGSCQAVCPD